MTGFKNFILKGNLIEIAVAFIMALAFAAVVTATVALIMDIIGKVGGQPDFSSYAPGGVSIGAWITAVISFLILTAVVYFFVVVPYNKLQDRMAKGEEPAPAAPEISLLSEIRDLLAGSSSPPTVRMGDDS